MMRTAAVLALSLAVTGCGFFSRSKSRFYSLERMAAPGAVAGARGVPVGIDSLELPPGFDRREVVVRTADHRLDVRGTEQWSAPFDALVLHTLASDLAARLPEGTVILPGAAKPAGVRELDVVFEELAAGPENAVALDAQWTLRENGVTASVHRERIRIEIDSLDSASVARGVSLALAALADRIASGL